MTNTKMKLLSIACAMHSICLTDMYGMQNDEKINQLIQDSNEIPEQLQQIDNSNLYINDYEFLGSYSSNLLPNENSCIQDMQDIDLALDNEKKLIRSKKNTLQQYFSKLNPFTQKEMDEQYVKELKERLVNAEKKLKGWQKELKNTKKELKNAKREWENALENPLNDTWNNALDNAKNKWG